MKRSIKFRWLIALIGQCIVCMLVALGVALAMWLGVRVHTILSMTVLPIFGAFSAYLATVSGLNNYIAWIVPPATGFIGHYALWGYAPDAAPILLCALISVIGAAAGEVVKRQRNTKK